MPIRGVISLPGDKSISHRALMLASLTDGNCAIHNISTGEDVETTRKCLVQCGIESEKYGTTVWLRGGGLKPTEMPLYCGNSGTTVRLMAGLLAGKGVKAKFTGDKSLSERPMNRIIDPLIKMGINIESENGYLPFFLTPGNVNGIDYTPQVASAQVKSCIILAGLGAFGETKVQEKIKTRDHTEIMLKELGAEIKLADVISIQPLKKPLDEFEITIPGDPSSAAFFAAAAAMIPNSDLTITNVLANTTRIGFFSVLENMGADIEWNNMRKEGGEWVGDVHIFSQPLNGLHIMKDLIPTVIDEIPMIAVLATQADSPTVIEGAAELRVKESDRIKAICQNLQSMGAEIIEKQDGFIINPVTKLHHTNIETFGDHRIAMAFTIAGLLPSEKNTLDDENCINISFPEFSEILSQICQ